ncbi:MAG: glutamate--tRNA ligase, partial [archaeon]|nr:glutamate--tRNA ligase [archaeon]
MIEVQPDVLLIIRKHALLNAYKHDGKCELGAVLGKVISERPDLKNLAKELYPFVKEIVDEVNRLSLDE